MNEQHANQGDEDHADFSSDQPPSKSSLKREAKQAFTLAQNLLQARTGKLRKLPLDEPLREAIAHGQAIRSHGARKRQTQHLAKLLRNSELVETIIHLIDQPEAAAPKASESARDTLHQRLVATMLEDFTAGCNDLQQHYPDIEIQNVRQLIRQMRNAQPASGEDETVDPKRLAVFRRARKNLMQLLNEQKTP